MASKKLSEREMERVHKLHKTGVKQAMLSRMYGVSPATIFNILMDKKEQEKQKKQGES